jgi:hypothetical protein
MKIIQLGAATGNDHVTKLVKSSRNIEFLLLVEPNPKVQSTLKDCYQFLPTTIIEQLAIVPNYNNGTEQNMFFAERDSVGGYQVTSLVKNHLEIHNYASDEIESFVTKCSTLQDLFEKYNISTLDYLFVDIECMDEEVLLGLDLDKYDIKNICIEVIHLKDADKLYSFLHKHGYVDKGKINLYDKMFTKESELRNAKIYQSCMFYNELDLLELQFEQNYNYVDKFIIVESNKTHAGNDKQLIFQQNIDRFSKYRDKIIHLVCSFDSELFNEYSRTNTDILGFMSEPWLRDRFQRDYPILCGEIDFKDHDILIVSDVDEIVNMPSVSNRIVDTTFRGPHKLEMHFMHYHINTSMYLTDTGLDKKWYHPFIVRYSELRNHNNSFSFIRTTPHTDDMVVKNAGWHFSYLLDSKGILNKVKNFAHCDDDFAKTVDTSKIEESIANMDLFYDVGQPIKLKKFPTEGLPTAVKNNLTKWDKYFWKSNKEKELLVIGCYLDTEVKKEILRKNLYTLRDTFDVVIVSHYPIDVEFQRLAKFTIYDSNNEVIHQDGYVLWAANAGAYTEHHLKSSIDPNYVVYQLMRTPLPMAKMLGYNSFFYMEGDLLVAEEDINQIINLKQRAIAENKSACFFNRETNNDSWWDCQLFYSEIDFFLHSTPTLLSPQEFRKYAAQIGSKSYIESFLHHLLYFRHTNKVIQLEMNPADYMTHSQLNITGVNSHDNTNAIEVEYYDETINKFTKFMVYLMKHIDGKRIFVVYRAHNNSALSNVEISINNRFKMTVTDNLTFVYQEVFIDEDLLDVTVTRNEQYLRQLTVSKQCILDGDDFIKLYNE